MLRRLFFVMLATSLLAACNSSAKKSSKAEAEAETASAVQGQTFGEDFDAQTRISSGELVTKMEGQDSMQLIVEGTVQEVCQAKGCWMVVGSEDNGKEPVMVRFKDYGFFVPKDIAGRKVVMEGWAFREVTPVEELRHYAEDAGKPQEEIEAITEPKEELKFLASGVLLLED